ncbi:MAG: 4Fe-4S binding protein [Syntrophales bacterium]|nr:4Fe-4S binding protein [Syntrophales bacterium]
MGKVWRKIVEIDEERCDGCGQCVVACAEGALQVINGKAKVIAEARCDGLGACIGDCPQGALRIVEGAAEPFAEETAQTRQDKGEAATLPCGCPSLHIQILERPQGFPAPEATSPSLDVQQETALTHWPIQIRLIPPTAPFLKDADLLVLADCTAVAYPALHRDLMKGKVVMMGCPKFDDVDDYARKFAAIFRTAAIRSITVVVMEVPCCSGMPAVVKRGMEEAGVSLPLKSMVLSLRGKILKSC